MAAKSDFTHFLARLGLVLALAALAVACTAPAARGFETAPAEMIAATTLAPSADEPLQNPAPAQAEAAPAATPAFVLPEGLQTITADNIKDISELGRLLPESPPYYHFSSDGARLAIGAGGEVRVVDTATGELLLAIPAELPECEYGPRRYFRLNAGGSFIALLNGQAIQVWQVGGGKIYESPFTSALLSGTPSCGADLPELSLSPDGRLLAVSGMDYSRTSVKRYFRVIRLLENEAAYEWDGKPGAPHGSLYAYDGLGFSDDGRLLQTFDPTRFILTEGDVYKAFRFWSVDEWQEVERTDESVITGFSPGALLFGLSDEDQVAVTSRISGDEAARVDAAGCQWDKPCELRFSAQGSQAFVNAHAAEAARYKNDALFQSLLRSSLASGDADALQVGLFRDLEGFFLSDGGQMLEAGQFGGGAGLPGWWTYKDYFTGFHAAKNGDPFFVPLQVGLAGDKPCQFCSACALDPQTGAVACEQGLPDSEGGRVIVRREGDNFVLYRKGDSGEAAISGLLLPEELGLSEVRVRLLAYAMPRQTLFYCVDENARQAGCFIFDPYQKQSYAAPRDISFLRISPDGSKAAFIDRSLNAMFIYDLETHKLVRKYPYQARAYPVFPYYAADGSRLYYVIQNLNNSFDLSVEILDALSGKSYGRVSLKKAGVKEPTSFEQSADGQLWFFSDSEGQVSVLSEKGALLHRWQAHADEVIGMALDRDLRWAVTMGEDNTIKFWGINK